MPRKIVVSVLFGVISVALASCEDVGEWEGGADASASHFTSSRVSDVSASGETDAGIGAYAAIRSGNAMRGPEDRNTINDIHPPSATWTPDFTPLATGSCCNSVVTYDDTNNYIGIGNTPVQQLDIGSHSMTNKSGTRITIGASSNISGINMGTTDNERAWIIWDGDASDEYLYLGTRSDSVSYSDTMVWRDGKVGIGTFAPDGELHIQGNSTTEPTWDSDDLLIVENDDNAYINLLGPTSGAIAFSDSTRAQGEIKYTHSDDKMEISTGGTTRITIYDEVRIGSGTPSLATGANDLYVAQDLEVGGTTKINPAGPAANSLCLSSSPNYYLSTCSSSARYKKSIRTISKGLDTVNKLRPVTFNWKADGANDLGFIAEEVEKIDPDLVTYKNGKVEGVKYRQMTAILASAIKELKQQSAELEAAICHDQPDSEFCRN